MLRATVWSGFLERTKPLEGICTWMYPDVLGLVTTGVGNLIDLSGAHHQDGTAFTEAEAMAPALPLPWFHAGNGAAATRSEIAAAWSKVKHSGLGKLGGASARVQMLTDLRLLESDVWALVQGKVVQNEAWLAKRFAPYWDGLPDLAQVGSLMLSWACGPAFRFPKFQEALEAADFYRPVSSDDETPAPGCCAAECQMSAASNPGNHLEERNWVTAQCFIDAAAAKARTEPAPAS